MQGVRILRILCVTWEVVAACPRALIFRTSRSISSIYFATVTTTFAIRSRPLRSSEGSFEIRCPGHRLVAQESKQTSESYSLSENTICTWNFMEPAFMSSDEHAAGSHGTLYSSADGMRPLLTSESRVYQKQRLGNEMRLLSVRLNGLAPISYLPDELLLSIFSLLVPRISSLDSFSPSLMTPSNSWRLRSQWLTVRRLLHVCQHWRKVALGCAFLWTSVDFRVSPFWTDFTLAHSQATPVQLMTNDVHQFDEREIDRISSNLHRVDAVCMYPDPSTAERVFSTLAGSAPLLRTLWLGSPGGVMTAPPFLRTELFSHVNAPRLKDVALANCVMPWTPSFFTHLTKLTLCHPDLNFYSERVHRTHEGLWLRPTLTELLNIFDGMSVIEDLTLLWILPNDASPRNDSRVVHLPRLSSLSLAGTPEEISTCVHHIECPTIRFAARFNSRSWDANFAQQCDHLSDSIKHHMLYSGPKLPLIDEVAISMGPEYVQVVAADSRYPKHQVDFAVHFECKARRNNPLSKMMRTLNLHSRALSRLSINLRRNPQHARDGGVLYWNSLFEQGCLRHAQHLELSGTELFFYLLQPPARPALHGMLDTLPFMRTVALCDVGISGPFVVTNPLAAVETRMRVRGALRELLENPAIRRLAFRNCPGATMPWLQSLREEFPDAIRWDGDTEAACISEPVAA
ncbi:hypothetical protein DENSPDRAFT_323801 [Dentipellis sp. KUC8613]|nr:hypothetical protein DENSPDRAFT_323801 [Dentipellis sp. KUC8613]